MRDIKLTHLKDSNIRPILGDDGSTAYGMMILLASIARGKAKTTVTDFPPYPTEKPDER